MDNEEDEEEEELTYYEHQQQHLRQIREEETRIRENETRIREEQRRKEEKKIRRQQEVDRFYEESKFTFYTLAGDTLIVPIKYIFSEMSSGWGWGRKIVKITKVDMVPKIEKYITDVYGYGEITFIQNDVTDLNGDLREGVIFYEKGSNTHMYLLNDIELSHYPRWYKALNNSTIVFGD